MKREVSELILTEKTSEDHADAHSDRMRNAGFHMGFGKRVDPFASEGFHVGFGKRADPSGPEGFHLGFGKRHPIGGGYTRVFGRMV